MHRYGTHDFGTVALMALGIMLMVVCSGCRSTRSEIREAYSEHHTDTVATTSADTLTVDDVAGVVRRDSASIASGDRGSIEIRRDSSGRPVFIAWNRDLAMAGRFSAVMLAQHQISTVRASEQSSHTGSLDILAKETAETSTEIDATWSVTRLLTGILAGVALWIIFGLVSNKFPLPWLRR